MSKNKIEANSGFLDFPLYQISGNDATLSEIRGEGKKGIIILTQAADTEKQLQFIGAVLSPLAVKIEDILLINTTSEAMISFAELGREHDFSTLVVMGIKPSIIGLQVSTQLYQSFVLQGKNILFAETVQTYIGEKEKGGNRTKAKQLWLSLKALV